MNNICDRKCYWNYDRQCCPEDAEHYKDGTAHTKKCTSFLSKNFEDRFVNTFEKCSDLLEYMNYKELKKAKYFLQEIKK